MNAKKFTLSLLMLATCTLSNASAPLNTSFGRKLIRAAQYSGIFATMGITAEIFYCNLVAKNNPENAHTLFTERMTARKNCVTTCIRKTANRAQKFLPKQK